jgi:hypothetical protein
MNFQRRTPTAPITTTITRQQLLVFIDIALSLVECLPGDDGDDDTSSTSTTREFEDTTLPGTKEEKGEEEGEEGEREGEKEK